MKIFVVNSLAVALTLLAVMPALAGSSVTRQVAVPYDDLDLTKSAGAATLRARIEAAAKSACAPEPDLKSLKVYADYTLCIRRSVEAASAVATSVRKTALKGK